MEGSSSTWLHRALPCLPARLPCLPAAESSASQAVEPGATNALPDDYMQPPDSWRLRPSAGNTAQMIENCAGRVYEYLYTVVGWEQTQAERGVD